MRWCFVVPLICLLLGSYAEGEDEANKPSKILFLAGSGSHGFGTHAHVAGSRLLAKALNESGLDITASVSRGWPKDPERLEGVGALVFFCDGGIHGLLGKHVAEAEALAAKGVGVACIHYALAEPKGERGNRLRRWIGGYYETWWSVNPIWTAHFKSFPAHAVTRGVEPFTIKDEWYYHMRFVEKMRGLTPVLTAVPPDSTRKRPDGAHSGNPHVRARMGEPEHVAWVYQRPDGGRGFGFTGAHWHWNWAHDDVRTLVLNALVWIAGGEVPPEGVPSETPSVEKMIAHLGSPPKDWSPKALQQRIEAWNR